MPQAIDQRGYVVPGSFRMKPGFGQTVAYTGTPGTIANPISQTYASGTITTTNAANVDDGETVSIGNKTYTFKTVLTPTEGEVLIGANADASLLNLIRAINHTGTPDTDYKCAAAHTQVSAASSVTSHAFAVTSLLAGVIGNSYSTLTDAVTLSWGSDFLTGGSNDARHTRFVRVMVTTAAFVRIGVDPTATTADYALAANAPEIFAIYPGEKVSAIQAASGGNLHVIELD